MGARTISVEVVQATLDGLHGIIDTVCPDSKHSLSWQLEAMEHCKRLIDTEENHSKANIWDQSLLRTSLRMNCDVSKCPDFLSGLLDGRLDHRMEMDRFPDSLLADHSPARVGFTHVALQAYMDSGLLNSSLQAFQTLQAISDSSRAKVIENFALKSPDELLSRQTLASSEFQETEDFPYTALTQIPDRTLGSFLDFLSALRLYHVGRWLLASQDIDGPMISEEKYSSSVLQPALLQFAAATSDVDLLSKVAAKLPVPLSRENTIALLHCQIALRQWDRVNDILINLQVKGFEVPLSSIAHVAQTIVVDEHTVLGSDRISALMNQAEHTLVRLIEGEYDQPPDYSSSPSFLRRRQVNQLSRILSTLPGRLASSTSALVKESGQSHATVLIDSKAFDLIVDGIVQAFGSSAGKDLWQRWCILPRTQRAVPFTQDGQEKVIRPTIRTLNFILAPQAPDGDKLASADSPLNNSTMASAGRREREVTTTTEPGRIESPYENLANRFSGGHSLLSWAGSVLRDFGQPESVIATELEPYVHR